MSSSASLEVAVLRAIRDAFGLELDDLSLARLGQLAENEFVGARSGIMDQMAASLADESTALFLDTRSLEFRRVPLPAEADLVVIHSGVARVNSYTNVGTVFAGVVGSSETLTAGALSSYSFALATNLAVPVISHQRVESVMAPPVCIGRTTFWVNYGRAQEGAGVISYTSRLFRIF